MENHLLSKTYRVLHNSPDNYINNNNFIDDPINQINFSLNQLLTSLKNDTSLTKNNLEKINDELIIDNGIQTEENILDQDKENKYIDNTDNTYSNVLDEKEIKPDDEKINMNEKIEKQEYIVII